MKMIRRLNRPQPFTAHHDPIGWQLYGLAFAFFASAFTIYFQLEQTLIDLLVASRWFTLFVGTGALAIFLLRKPLRAGPYDGLFYSFFGIAPIASALFLTVNAQCTATFEETYGISTYEQQGGKYVLELQSGAYDEFLRIRKVHRTAGSELNTITYTFCNGRFGYKVMIDHHTE